MPAQARNGAAALKILAVRKVEVAGPAERSQTETERRGRDTRAAER